MHHPTPSTRHRAPSPTHSLHQRSLIYFLDLFKHNNGPRRRRKSRNRKQLFTINLAFIFVSQILYFAAAITTAVAVAAEDETTFNHRNYLIERINFNIKQLAVDHADDSTQTTKVELSPIENINNIVYKKINTDMAKDMNELETRILISLDMLIRELETNLHNISVSQYIDRSSFQVLNTIKTLLANCNINQKGDIKSTKPKRNNK